ncbi:MAG: hypothetical protein EAY75_05160 [Bacteroidetes bacterium]|nr:MAG: hypothetical protein EAY75_05160 [Bacteroidota bacterium]
MIECKKDVEIIIGVRLTLYDAGTPVLLFWCLRAKDSFIAKTAHELSLSSQTAQTKPAFGLLVQRMGCLWACVNRFTQRQF